MVAAAGSRNLEGHLTLRRATITMYISIQIEGGQKLKVIESMVWPIFGRKKTVKPKKKKKRTNPA